MILPGISGSFILLMLKKYAYIFNAVGHFNFAIIVPFTIGMITGLALFSRVLSWLLKKLVSGNPVNHHWIAYCIIMGDMAISGTNL